MLGTSIKGTSEREREKETERERKKKKETIEKRSDLSL